jgi:site-specific recombinase XerD
MVQNIVKKYIEKAGLDPQRYSTHKLRHTAATLMFQNGVDVRVLQEVLGHENLGTTQIYTHLGEAQLEQAANANPLGQIRRNKEE